MQDTGFNLLPLMKKAHELKNAAPHQTPAPDAQIFLQAVLRTLRRQNYMTQNDIAGALDLSHSTIQSIEGTKIPGIKQDRFFSDKILYAYAQRELSLKKALDILATEVLYPHGIKTTLDLLLLLSKKSDKSIDQIGEGASVNHLNSKLQKSNSRILHGYEETRLKEYLYKTHFVEYSHLKLPERISSNVFSDRIMTAEKLSGAIKAAVDLQEVEDMSKIENSIANLAGITYSKSKIYNWLQGEKISKLLFPLLNAINELVEKYNIHLTDLHRARIIELAEDVIHPQKNKVSITILNANSVSEAINIPQRKRPYSISHLDIANAFNFVTSESGTSITENDSKNWKRNGVPVEHAYTFPEALRHAINEKAGLWLTTDAKAHITHLIKSEHAQRQAKIKPAIS
jgi:transcriptional regulator with XRE-family HTH domain